ncbi:EcsC family protein [Nocardioides ganghwensis]|jgi:hypothetical protein|uniref:EcsC family protein n=1 Tax=Nocardioides ganghwensis TaxID=252230 RepID=A0A4V1RM99_9ACTN|nr:EcsC family protein [Nocardioides ganghwensis]MBD3947302.1 EcsC family protein [Nocardioides ganghwensis]RYC00251.1 hypothetical protein EUA07_14005 [Nocardioides ganghwensis]
MGLKQTVGRQLAPKIQELTPGLSAGFVREALNRAIDGIGPLAPAADAADKQLREQRGNVERAIHEVIENNVRIAGAQGFATNVGGLVTMAVAIPANVTGLAVIQCRMVAGIAHLRGHDLTDPRVRNAILALLLGEEHVTEMVKKKKLPATPMALATAPVHDPSIDGTISAVVASDIFTRVVGKRLATTVGRRVPVIGGVVGMGADAFATWKVGRYADRELLPRRR